MRVSTITIHMDWTQLFAENPFLIVSILSGTGAAAVLVGAILNSKRRSASLSSAAQSNGAHGELQNKRWQRTIFDRITLLNRNLIQCPRCFKIDFANVRFCTGCGMRIMPNAESFGGEPSGIVTHYAIQDEATRFVGISMKPNARTRIGVIVGLHDNEPQTKTDRVPEN